MNVLVVDDEPIIRLGLRTLVEWERHGFSYAGDAEDGLDAWQAIERDEVDIVITDLIMPRMDGLELIRKLKESGKDMIVIVLSCMDDFNYVKEAMKLGARDYILKPTMEPESLLAVLQSVRQELLLRREERSRQLRLQQELALTKQSQLSARLLAYLQGGREDEQLQAELHAATQQAGGVLYSLLLDTGRAAAASPADWSWSGCLAALPLTGSCALLLVPAAPEKRAAAGTGGPESTAAALAAAAEREEARLLLAPGWFVGAGLQVRRLADVRHAAALHERQRHERFYSGSWNRIVLGAPGCEREPEQAAAQPLPHDCRSDLLRCIAAGNAEGIRHQAAGLCRFLRQQRPSPELALAFAQELLGLAAGYARERGYARIDEFEDIYVASRSAVNCSRFEQVERLLLEAFGELAASCGGQGGERSLRSQNPFIRKALQFMKDNYASAISTLDIAEHVRLSRSYLSDLYSKEMGESLSETLTRIRMEEAKQRLRSGNMKVYEVAEAVGFPDAKVFARTFKRMVGCSPKEFE